MSTKPLYESTLHVKKIISKKDVKNDKNLSNSISDAIQCLVNAGSSKSKSVWVNITINVASVESEGKEDKNIVETVSNEHPAIESEELVNKVKVIDGMCSYSNDLTSDIIHELVELEELELSRNTPVKNLKVKRQEENANKRNNSNQPEAMKNKLYKNEKVNNCELTEMDKQCWDKLNLALEQLLKKRRVTKSVIHEKFKDLKEIKDRKNKIANKRNKQIKNTNNIPNFVIDDVYGTEKHLNKKRKTGKMSV